MNVNLSNHFCSDVQVVRILSMVKPDGVNYESLIADCNTIFRVPTPIIKNTFELLLDSNVLSRVGNVITLLSSDYKNHVRKYILNHSWLSSVSTALTSTNDGNVCIDIYRLPKSHRYFHQVLNIADMFKIKTSNAMRLIPIKDEFTNDLINIISKRNQSEWLNRRIITPSQLTDINLRKSEVGYEAELWVLQREKIRLKNHLLFNNIRMVSLENVAEGFDIVSFQSLHSMSYDRLLEVKSYSGSPRIFISRNEIMTAKHYGEKYVLVIVDRDRIMDEAYTPREYINPFQMMFSDNKPNWINIEPTTFEITFNFYINS
jgi:hypothetical protein